MPALMQDFQFAVPQSEAVQVEWEVLCAHGVMLSLIVNDCPYPRALITALSTLTSLAGCGENPVEQVASLRCWESEANPPSCEGGWQWDHGLKVLTGLSSSLRSACETASKAALDLNTGSRGGRFLLCCLRCTWWLLFLPPRLDGGSCRRWPGAEWNELKYLYCMSCVSIVNCLDDKCVESSPVPWKLCWFAARRGRLFLTGSLFEATWLAEVGARIGICRRVDWHPQGKLRKKLLGCFFFFLWKQFVGKLSWVIVKSDVLQSPKRPIQRTSWIYVI